MGVTGSFLFFTNSKNLCQVFRDSFCFSIFYAQLNYLNALKVKKILRLRLFLPFQVVFFLLFIDLLRVLWSFNANEIIFNLKKLMARAL